MQIFEKVLTLGDATYDELQVCMGMLPQAVSARINELVNKKRLIWTGKTRLTRYKRPARVYRVNDLPF